MTLAIELTPEQHEKIEAAARKEGKPINEYAQDVLLRYLDNCEQAANRPGRKAPPPVSREEQQRLLDELAQIGAHLPPSPPGETYSREMIYTDDD